MAAEVSRGEIWMFDFASPDKRRPVLVISRQVLLDVLGTATVVPITRTMHGSPTEIELGLDDGLEVKSCANLANIQTVPKAKLTRYVGTVRGSKLAEMCEALAIAVGCD